MKSDRIFTVVFIIVAGFALSVIFHYSMGNYFGFNSYPHNTFLFTPADKFNDFFNIYRATEHLNPYSNPLCCYFPFTYMPVYLLTLIPEKLALAILVGIFICSVYYIVYRSNSRADKYLKNLCAFSFTFMSYPVLFTIDRGNLEIIVFLFLAIFFYYYQAGDDKKSVFFLALASAMKLYPGIFVVLFLADRKYKSAAYTVVIAIVVSLVSASILSGGIFGSLQGLQQNLAYFKQTYFFSGAGVQHNNSIYGIFNIIHKIIPSAAPILGFYSIIALAIFVFVSMYIIFVEKQFWKRTALLVFMMLLLPQVSFDYKLIHVIFVVMLFFKSQEVDRHDVFYAMFLGLLLIPKDYILLKSDISIAVLLNPLIMVLIAARIMLNRPVSIK